MNKKILSLGTIGVITAPLAFAISCANSIHDQHIKQGAIPTKTVTTELKGVKSIDRTGAGVWKRVSSYTVILGDNASINMGDVISGMYLFETKIFKYYVDLRAYINKDEHITRPIFEKFVKKFEANVNYGIGAYFERDKFIGKPAIEFLAGSGGISWGGETGSEITLSKANPKNVSWSGDGWINTTAYLALHEYGHHETTVSTRLFTGKSVGQFDPLKTFLDSKGESKFTKYWASQATVGVGDFAKTIRDYQTPFGIIKSGSNAYAKPGYNWHSSEFATRVEAAFESNFSKESYISSTKEWAASGDIGGMARAFGGSTIFEPGHIDNLIDGFKQKIYGFNHKTKSNSSAIGVVLTSDKIADSKEYTIEFTDTNYSLASIATPLVTLFGNVAKTWKSTNDIKAYYATHKKEFTFKIPVHHYPVEYRFNNDFRNIIPEEIVKGTALILDNADVKVNALRRIKGWPDYIKTLKTKLLKGSAEVNLTEM